MRRAPRLKASSEQFQALIAAKSAGRKAEAKHAAEEASQWARAVPTQPVLRQPLWWLRLIGIAYQLLIFAKRWRTPLIASLVVAVVVATPPGREAIVDTTHRIKDYVTRLVTPTDRRGADLRALGSERSMSPVPPGDTDAGKHELDGLAPTTEGPQGLPPGARTYQAVHPVLRLTLLEPVDAVLSTLAGRCEWTVQSTRQRYTVLPGDLRLVELHRDVDGTLPILVNNTASTVDRCLLTLFSGRRPISSDAAAATAGSQPSQPAVPDRPQGVPRNHRAEPAQPAIKSSSAARPASLVPGPGELIKDLRCPVKVEVPTVGTVLCPHRE